MNMKEALETAEKTCNDCLNKKGMCTEEDRDKCWIYNAMLALLYRKHEKPIAVGMVDTPNGKRLQMRCPNCTRWLKNDKRNGFCQNCGKAIDWEE